MLKVNHYQTKSRILKLFLATIFLNTFILQARQHPFSKEKIDSLYQVYFNDYANHQKGFHELVQQSKALNYNNGLYKNYMMLMFYHGSKKQVDSMLYYQKKVEGIKTTLVDTSTVVSFYNNKGVLYSAFLGNVSKSIENYQKALTYLPDNDTTKIEQRISIKKEIGYCYIMKQQYDKAIQTLTITPEEFKHVRPETLTIFYSYKAMAWQYKKRPDKSLPLHKKALSLTQKQDVIAYIKNNITYDYYLQKQYQKAIDSALAIRQFMNHNRIDYLYQNSAFLATYHGAIQEYTKAISYSKENIKLTPTFLKLPDYYRELAEFYEKTGQTQLALKAEKKGLHILDSIRKQEQQFLASIYEDKVSKTPKDNIQSDTKKHTIWVNSVIFLFLISWLIIYYQYHKNKKTKKIETNSIQQIALSHTEEKENKFSYSHSIKTQKRRESITDKEEGLYDIERMKENAKTLFSSDPEEILSKKLEDSEFIFFIESLKNRHPNLSNTDIKHCLFIYAGMSLKDTAGLLNVSVNTVKNARYRAKTRINPPNHLNFKIYLEQLNELYHKVN